MKPGDLVIHRWLEPQMIGILLDVSLDKNLMKSPFAVPWRYRILWTDGSVKEHETGSIMRFMINETR